MSNRTYTCDKKDCKFCYEINRLTILSDPEYKPATVKKLKARRYYKRLLKSA